MAHTDKPRYAHDERVARRLARQARAAHRAARASAERVSLDPRDYARGA